MKLLPLIGALLLCLEQEVQSNVVPYRFQYQPFQMPVPEKVVRPYNPYLQHFVNHRYNVANQPIANPYQNSGFNQLLYSIYQPTPSPFAFHPISKFKEPLTNAVEPSIFEFGDEWFSNAEDQMALPSRAAVEHVPILGSMNLLRMAEEADHDDDDTPFSRSGVEAYPSVESVYLAEPSIRIDDYETNKVVLKSAFASDDENYPLIGYRAAVESPPQSANLNIYDYFREYKHDMTSVDNEWHQHITAESSPVVSTHQKNIRQWKNPVVSTRSAADYKIVCYFQSWAHTRRSPLNFEIKNIDPHACTHLIYAFAGLDSVTYTMKSLNQFRDIEQGGFKAAVALKMRNPNLKVLIGLGGHSEGGFSYSEMVSSQETRANFLSSVDDFIATYGFDGLDFNWQHPAATDRGGQRSDKQNLLLLCQEMKKLFATKDWILTLSLPIVESLLRDGYDVAGLSQCAEFFNVMTYDLRKPESGIADHHAPMTSKLSDGYIHKELNIKDGIQLLLNEGVPQRQLVLGIPFFGRSFTLEHPKRNLPGSKIISTGKANRYTNERGHVAYYEVCMHKRNGDWTLKKDEVGGSYMFKGDQWIGFDDEKSVEEKAMLIMREHLGGAAVWSLDVDDYLGMCGKRWPLLSTIRRVFGTPSFITVPYIMPTTVATSTTIVRDVTTTTTTEPSMQEQETKRDNICTGGFSSKEGDCQAFFMCNQGKFIEKRCAQGLHWNNAKNICDWPKSANCMDSATASPGTVITSSTTTIPIETDNVGITKPDSTENLPYVGPVTTPLSGDYKVVCYFTNWARYRPGIGKYFPVNIDSTTCTHIVYGFAVLDSNTLLIKPHDTWADIDSKFYEQVTALKQKGIKVTLAIGGWNDSKGGKYSKLVNNPESRRKFINHVVQFIKAHNFDGLDLDWEYPVCWQVDCAAGPRSDKDGFSNLVKELHQAFKKDSFLLSAAVSPSKKVIDLGYDVPVMNKYMDWIAVMTYDFHGHWDKKTGHVAPMYEHPDDDFSYFNMDFAIKYYIQKGAARNKLIMGLPLYGQSFTLNDPSNKGLNSPAGKGIAGQFTRAAGFLSYYEICDNIKSKGWTVVNDHNTLMGPYAYKGNQWVSYDNVETIRKKSQYIRENNLGGGMVWALDLDDFTNRCGQGAYPLMNTIKKVLGPPSSRMKITVISPPEIKETGMIPSVTNAPITEHKLNDEFKVVCYFTNWAWYRPGIGKYTPDNIDPTLCTHINFGFAVLDPNTFTIKTHDNWADVDNRFYERVVAYKSQGIKVLLALGGWNDSLGSKYSRLVNDKAKRAKFIEHAIKFLQQYNFDGLDLDWEYPKCWQVDCNKGPDTDKAAFADWIKELHAAFKPLGLLLTAAVSPSSKVIDAGYDVPALSRYLDFINVMTYDYHGQWDKKTGHVAPMFEHPDDDNKNFNMKSTTDYWIAKGADPKKLILGMPMYGQSFTLVNPDMNGLNQKASGGGRAGQFTRASGFLAYYEICEYINDHRWKVVRDPLETMGPYAFNGNQWVGFDDIPQIEKKSKYVKDRALGGAMIWALDLDDFTGRCGCGSHPLLKTINRVLRGYPQYDKPCPLLGGNQADLIPSITSEKVTYPSVTIGTTSEVSLSEGMISLTLDGKSCKNGEFQRHSTDCSKFYECFKGVLREKSCYYGGHWDGKSRCRHPVKAKCSMHSVIPAITMMPITPMKITQQPITMALSTQISTTEGTTPSILVGKACHKREFRKHPSDCSKFYICVREKFVERSCYKGGFWDGWSRCRPAAQVDCSIQGMIQEVTKAPYTTVKETKPTTMRATTAKYETILMSTPAVSVPLILDDKPCVNGEFHNHPTDCSKFYECFKETLRVVSCYVGGHWDGKRRCRSPVQANCQQVTLIRESGKRCRSGEYKNHPTICNQFYQCVHKRFELSTCFPGLNWNGKDRCTWKYLVKCDQQSMVPLMPVHPKPVSTTGTPVIGILSITRTSGKPVATSISTTTARSTTQETRKYSGYGTYPTEKATPPKITPTTDKWWNPTTTTTTPSPTHCPDRPLETTGPKVVCYFTNWAWYRRGSGKFLPEDINPRLCTHIIYGFAVLDGSRLVIKPHDSWADFDNSMNLI